MAEKQAQIDYLKAKMLDSACNGMYKAARQIVFGSGNPDADMMLVGEAPGDKEDKSGEPFVGRAGEMLDRLLGNVAVEREQVYIANVMKWRPPGNRDPEPAEILLSAPYLHAQIAIIQPKVLVAVGRFAVNLLSGQEQVPMGALRENQGLLYEKGSLSIPVVAIYHPAYLLRNMNNEGAFRATVRDLQRAVNILKKDGSQFEEPAY